MKSFLYPATSFMVTSNEFLIITTGLSFNNPQQQPGNCCIHLGDWVLRQAAAINMDQTVPNNIEKKNDKRKGEKGNKNSESNKTDGNKSQCKTNRTIAL